MRMGESDEGQRTKIEIRKKIDTEISCLQLVFYMIIYFFLSFLSSFQRIFLAETQVVRQ